MVEATAYAAAALMAAATVMKMNSPPVRGVALDPREVPKSSMEPPRGAAARAAFQATDARREGRRPRRKMAAYWARTPLQVEGEGGRHHIEPIEEVEPHNPETQ